jgi:hypothetical protein
VVHRLEVAATELDFTRHHTLGIQTYINKGYPPPLIAQIVGFFFKPETSTRYALHVHFDVIQPALQGTHAERMLGSDDAPAVLGLVERLMCGYLPPRWTVERRGTTLAAVAPGGYDLRPHDGRTPSAARLPPLDGPREELRAHQARSAVENQVRYDVGGYLLDPSQTL